MTKEGSTAIVNSMTTVIVVFVQGRVPITAFLSFKYFMQGLINGLYIKILDGNINTPLNNENVQGAYLVTLSISSSSANGKKIKVKLCTIGQQV